MSGPRFSSKVDIIATGLSDTTYETPPHICMRRSGLSINSNVKPQVGGACVTLTKLFDYNHFEMATSRPPPEPPPYVQFLTTNRRKKPSSSCVDEIAVSIS